MQIESSYTTLCFFLCMHSEYLPCRTYIDVESSSYNSPIYFSADNSQLDL